MLEPSSGLRKAILMLLLGGVLAQSLALILGPLITRLYSPQEFDHYAVFAALAAYLAVIACARYDCSLPLVKDEGQARDVMALCMVIFFGVTILSCPLARVLAWAGWLSAWGWLPVFVGSVGLVQWLTLWATRAQQFSALSGP